VRLLLITTLCGLGATACEDTTVGQCCKVLPGRDPNTIPQPEFDMATGEPRDVIRQDPAFDCGDDSFICVSYQASRAYCTATCLSDSTCPEGFSCRQVIESDPGPDSQLKNTDKFCVKDMHMCTE
jgi:hypothetical protein